MQFVIGSATIAALVLLIFAVTIGPTGTCLRKERYLGYILSCAIAGLVTLGNTDHFALLLGPALALYEAAAFATR